MLSARVRRHLLGVFALFFLGLSLVLLVSFEEGTLYALGSMCWRIGLTLAVLWLALPQVLQLMSRVPPRVAVAVVLGGLVVVATKGRALLPVLLVILLLAGVEFLGWLLKPLPRRRDKR